MLSQCAVPKSVFEKPALLPSPFFNLENAQKKEQEEE
jgi:hypothetical protein